MVRQWIGSFTMTNTGTVTVTGLSLGINGTDAASFSVTPKLPTSLGSGVSTTFTVRFSALSGGARSATIRLYSSQGEEMAIRFSATVALASKMELRDQAGKKIAPSVQGIVGWGYNGDGRATAPAGPDRCDCHHGGLQSYSGVETGWHGGRLGATSMGNPRSLLGSQVLWPLQQDLFHTVALKQNGTVVAWGSNYAGQIGVPTGLRDVAAIAAGSAHTLALKKDGTVAAWGRASVPAGLTGVALPLQLVVTTRQL